MKFSSIAAAGAVFGLAAATPITKRSSISKRQVPQEQSHGFILAIADEFMKLENTLNIQDAVFGLLGNAAAKEGAGDVTNLDCLKQATADQAFTNAKAAGDLRGMAGALMFQAIERNTGKVGQASVLCNEPTVNPEIGALISHQDAASENAGAINKAVTLELARQLAGIGADPNLALLTGTFAPGDVNDNTGAGLTCDTEDRKLGCIYTEKRLVLDATEDEVASAVSGVQQTFTGTGGISATDLVNLADFDVAKVTGNFDLAKAAPGSGAAATADAGAAETPAATPAETAAAETPAAETPAATTAADAEATEQAGATGRCSLITMTIGADQASAIKAQYPAAVMREVNTPAETAADASATEAAQDEAAADEQKEDKQGNQNGNGNDNNNQKEDKQGNQNGNGNNNQKEDNKNDNASDGAAAAAGGNLQTFAGDLGGAAPPVQNNGNADRPFEVNGATFTNEAAALVRSCDIQNNQCFNAVNSGELAGGTQQCAQQLQQCQANAGGRKARRNQILGGGNPALLGGNRAGGNRIVNGGAARLVSGGANRVVGGNNAVIGGGGINGLILGGAQSLNLGNFLGGGNIAQLIGGGVVGGAIGGGRQIIQPSRGNQQLVAVILQQSDWVGLRVFDRIMIWKTV
ncbi:hypothetical protein NLU13_5298 [Sarocladium strictum]|uniref:Uncharacterized protein n=1 Tax=Sarocladium strictum TaxID=5046 RepID=A0AA39GHC8_SARSR|nr:hypothetical protein NLU13_5298 [Sarocladium strictum]